MVIAQARKEDVVDVSSSRVEGDTASSSGQFDDYPGDYGYLERSRLNCFC